MRFIFNSFFAIFLAVCVSSAASLIGTDVIGLEQPPKNAAIIRNGFAPQNPAINAFENRTKFSTVVQYESANAQSSSNSISLNSFTVPSISMVLPIGFFGALGIALEQKFFANNRFELIDPALDANLSYSSRIGLYELLPSYSIRLPFFLSDFAVGTSYRIFFGNSYSALERGPKNDLGDDVWIAKNVQVTEVKSGEFESDDDWWRNFGYSLHFHKKSVDYFFSYFPSVQMQKSIRENVQFSDTDTLQSKKETENFKMPKRFASGVHFRFLQNQNFSFVYEQQNFEKSGLDGAGESFSLFTEYKMSGTGLNYSTFLKKNDFGVNAWYAQKYLKDVNEIGVSLFSDLFIGHRGTLVGIALFGGRRQAEEPYWDEPFYGFKLSLTGVSNWGTSFRRK